MSSSVRFLLVGDGDLSFCAAFCDHLRLCSQSVTFPSPNVSGEKHVRDILIVGTTFPAYDDLLQQYGEALLKNIGIINACNNCSYDVDGQRPAVTIRVKTALKYGVDATKIVKTLILRSTEKEDLQRPYNVIVFNFPHPGGKNRLKLQRKLLRDFFEACNETYSLNSPDGHEDEHAVLAPHGQVRVALTAGQGGTPVDRQRPQKADTWQIVEQAAAQSFVLSDVHRFFPSPTAPLVCYALGLCDDIGAGRDVRDSAPQSLCAASDLYCPRGYRGEVGVETPKGRKSDPNKANTAKKGFALSHSLTHIMTRSVGVVLPVSTPLSALSTERDYSPEICRFYHLPKQFAGLGDSKCGVLSLPPAVERISALENDNCTDMESVSRRVIAVLVERILAAIKEALPCPVNYVHRRFSRIVHWEETLCTSISSSSKRLQQAEKIQADDCHPIAKCCREESQSDVQASKREDLNSNRSYALDVADLSADCESLYCKRDGLFIDEEGEKTMMQVVGECLANQLKDTQPEEKCVVSSGLFQCMSSSSLRLSNSCPISQEEFTYRQKGDLTFITPPVRHIAMVDVPTRRDREVVQEVIEKFLSKTLPKSPPHSCTHISEFREGDPCMCDADGAVQLVPSHNAIMINLEAIVCKLLGLHGDIRWLYSRDPRIVKRIAPVLAALAMHKPVPPLVPFSIHPAFTYLEASFYLPEGIAHNMEWRTRYIRAFIRICRREAFDVLHSVRLRDTYVHPSGRFSLGFRMMYHSLDAALCRDNAIARHNLLMKQVEQLLKVKVR